MLNSNSRRQPEHVGIYIKRKVLPKDMSITEAADKLGVGRPALSNLINGNASLSSEMAIRFERTFKLDALQLINRQAEYDEWQARQNDHEIAVRTHVNPYSHVSARQISAWGSTNVARNQLSVLLRTLVNSTGRNLTEVDFPGFDEAQTSGWDGSVHSESVTPWIPNGVSRWEMGCGTKVQTKAQNDYAKRTAHECEISRSQATFVFVTPHEWSDKDKWIAEKRLQHEWKDVRAFDANDLEQWIEQSIPAQLLMRKFLGHSVVDVRTLSDLWREWAEATDPVFPRELFSPAVNEHLERIEWWLKEPPNKPFVVSAESTLEAIAFLSCALNVSQEKASNPNYADIALVIRSLNAFDSIYRVVKGGLLVVDSNEVEQKLAGTFKENHTFIVRCRNIVFGDTDITLELLDHLPFYKALQSTGLGHAKITQLSQESARSLTILRRRLATVKSVCVPPWANDPAVAPNLVPVILTGAWDTENPNDCAIINSLTRPSTADFETSFSHLMTLEQSPVWSVGRMRGITSKIDALFSNHMFMSKADLETFFSIAELVLCEEDPALDLPEDQRVVANIYNKNRKHSNELRMGIRDSLVLLSVYGKQLFQDRLNINIETEADRIVRKLLNPSSKRVWSSQKNDLTYYAEAAPEAFLEMVELDLRNEHPQLRTLFNSADTGVFGECPRSGMLWALELLAWYPEHFPRVTRVLAELCKWPLEDNWSNKPMASLRMIFRSWLPQTSATLEERILALNALVDTYPDVGWHLCMEQFVTPGPDFVHTNRPRWRSNASVDESSNESNREGQQFKLAARELALSWSSHNEQTLGELVEHLYESILTVDDRRRVWEAVTLWVGTGPSERQKANLRERIRRALLTNRGYTRNVDSDTLRCARDACTLLQAQDVVMRHEWLFLTPWVEDTYEGDSNLEVRLYEDKYRDERIAAKRTEALVEVWQEVGLEGIKQLCFAGNAANVVGRHMAKVCSSVTYASIFLQGMMATQSGEDQGASDQCLTGFLEDLDSNTCTSVVNALLPKLDTNSSIRLLCCAPFTNDVWDIVNHLGEEIKQRYWQEVTPRDRRQDSSEMGIIVDELTRVKRPRAAFNTVQYRFKLLDSYWLICLLSELARDSTEPSNEYLIERYYVAKAFEELNNRLDVFRDVLVRLEFTYIDALIRTDYGIPNVEHRFCESPSLFGHALVTAFAGEDDKKVIPSSVTKSSSERRHQIRVSRTLLRNISRIPGTSNDNTIDAGILKDWLIGARKIAQKHGYREIGDQMIGELLSKCSEGKDGVWPCESIREVIEDIGTEELATGLIIGRHNARGVVRRDKGGTQELILAQQYRRWSREVAYEHEFTRHLLIQIAKDYEAEAKWWDNEDAIRQRLSE